MLSPPPTWTVTALAIQVWVAAIIILMIGASILWRERGSNVSGLLFFVTATFAWYLGSFGFVYSSNTAESALTWSHIAYLGVPLIPPAIYHFSSRVMRIYEQTRPMARTFWVIGWAFVVMGSQTGLMVGRVEQFSFGWFPRYSALGLLFGFYAVCVTVMGQWNYIHELRRTPKGTPHYHRLNALKVGFFLGYAVMIDFLPKFGIDVYPAGYSALLAFAIVAGSVVWKYRLVDITPAIAAPQVFASMSDAVVVYDREGTIRLVNDSATRSFARLVHPFAASRNGNGNGNGVGKTGGGHEVETLIGHPIAALFPSAQADAQVAAGLRGGTLPSDEIEVSAGGDRRIYSLTTSKMRYEGEEADAFVLVARDITLHRTAEERIAYSASHDTLTNLPNRALLLRQVDAALQRRRDGQVTSPCALFCVGLDRFNLINESYGHVAGDQVLREAARRLAHVLGEDDMLARLAGDDFAVLLGDASSQEQALAVADWIQDELAAPFIVQGKPVFVTASIGVAISTAGAAESAIELLRNADISMYGAKAEGMSRAKVFDPTMRDRVVSNLELEMDLRTALDRDEFEVYYQPIVSIDRAQVTGFEALVRWRREGQAPVEPARFIPLAESTGLIVVLGRRVLRDACRQLRVWQAAFPDRNLSMSVNLSAKQFAQDDVVADIASIIRETGVDPSRLRLEITESVLITNVELAIVRFAQLRELGVRLAMDDFGTGYSSFGSLHQFQMDTLKIDQSFVRNLEVHDRNADIVRAIVAVARSFDMSVVAEGVETIGQLEFLTRLECDHAQGFYFSRAVNAAAATELIVGGLKEGSQLLVS
jgi:diguanylate cyclase (GGDEF)-like protein